MQDILRDFSATELVKASIKANWENYHYCLGRAPSVELSIGRYLTWLITNMPDHFMNLVVCTQLPIEGIDELIDNVLTHFKSLNISKLSWLAREGLPAIEIKKYLIAHGLTFSESFATEMAADRKSLQDKSQTPSNLKILPVVAGKTLRQWIHVASMVLEFGKSSRKFGTIFLQRRFLIRGFEPICIKWTAGWQISVVSLGGCGRDL